MESTEQLREVLQRVPEFGECLSVRSEQQEGVWGGQLERARGQ